jgi:hypothetical protein
MLLRSAFLLVSLLSLTSLAAEDARPPETVGTLDFFGLRRVTEAEVRTALKLKEGDPFSRTTGKSLVAELEKIPGVHKATVAPITVDGTGKLKVFIGIQEEGAIGFTLRDAPEGTQRLPDELAQIYRDFMTALGPAVRKGGGGDDHSQGHALSANPDLRKPQDAAVAHLKENASLVRDVLKSSSNADDRRAAAWLLGYAPDKKSITADLVAAARDPDGTVRNNATRALAIIAEFAATRPALGISIEPDVFLDMLRSVTWTDRNKVSFLLDGMTKTGAAELLRTLRERAMPELIEMARWKSDGHAFPAIRILGRIAGWEDQRIFRTWREGGVEKLIAAASAAK